MAKKKNFLEELLINPNNKAPAAKHVQAKKKQKIKPQKKKDLT